MTIQTENERFEIADAWSKQYQGLLAETATNVHILRKILERYPVISVDLICRIVELKRSELEWLASPTPVTPKLRGTFADKLYQCGIAVSPHMSHAEKQDSEKSKAVVYRQILDDAAIQSERRSLKQRLSEAESIVVTIKTGPYTGRTSHAATAEARKSALQKLRQEVDTFNRANPEHPLEM